MDIKRIWAVYFSPTGGTQNATVSVATQLGRMLDIEVAVIDFTTPEHRQETYFFHNDELVVFGMPVYAGRIPNKILPFIESGFQGNNTGLIPIVSYGNRSFGDALMELKEVLGERGFCALGAAAVVSEHAFTSVLGTLRPDACDKQEIHEFVAKISDKILHNTNITKLYVKGNSPVEKYYTPLKEDGTKANFLPAKPVTDIRKCNNCGICAQVCPMGSIDQANCSQVSGICIKCQACIKKCPEDAKYFTDKDFISHVKMLELNYSERADNRFFI